MDVRGVEQLGQAAPAGHVPCLTMRARLRKVADLQHERRLEHERQTVLEVVRLQFVRAGLLERVRIGAVRRHAAVQTGAALYEAYLRVVLAVHHAHELGHGVAVVVRRTE